MASLRGRLQVAEKLAHSEASYHDQIPLDEPTAENIIEQISKHFSPKEAEQHEKLANSSAIGGGWRDQVQRRAWFPGRPRRWPWLRDVPPNRSVCGARA